MLSSCGFLGQDCVFVGVVWVDMWACWFKVPPVWVFHRKVVVEKSVEKVVNRGGVEKRAVLHRVCNRLPTGWQGWFWLILQGFVVVVHSFHRAYYYVYYSPYSYLTLG